MTPFDGKCQNLQKTPTHFLRQLSPFQRYENLLFFTLKSSSDTMTPFDSNQKIYKRHFFCASSYRFRDINILNV